MRFARPIANLHGPTTPDVSTEADADKKFAEVQEAYEVLSDAEKRAAFDRFGRVGTPSSGARHGYRPGGTAGGGPGGRPGQQVDPSQFEDIFEQMFGGGGPGGPTRWWIWWRPTSRPTTWRRYHQECLDHIPNGGHWRQ